MEITDNLVKSGCPIIKGHTPLVKCLGVRTRRHHRIAAYIRCVAIVVWQD